MPKTHSTICYIYELEGGFKAVQKAHTIKNDLGLDLFAYNNALYEGQTGLRVIDTVDLSALKERIEQIGGVEKIKETIRKRVNDCGLSPRYTHPDEKSGTIFPPDKDEDVVFATEASGDKHYYRRIYNENGIELFARNNDKESYATVYVPCNGYMIAFGQKHMLDEIIKQLSTFEEGVYGEIERRFNAAMNDPKRYVDLQFARILDRLDEAQWHNAPILEQREAEDRKRQNDRAEQERRDKEVAERACAEAIVKAETALLAGEMVFNHRINGKSIVLQLFREHSIELPLRTQGWVNHSLSAFSYRDGCFQARCNGRLSDSFSNGVAKLCEAILSKNASLISTNAK